ncbi:MAG: rhombosortase [Rhodoferax sp.]|nr:rhombosortase [Rhodoferax sp.]
MAPSTWDGDGRGAWLGLASGLAAASVLTWWLPSAGLDWQPNLVFSQPWRWFSAAWVHWSALHLGANLGALAVVAAWGWVAQVDRRAALAWALAWPATHAVLLLRPELQHYGGLSGMLHAAVVVVLVQLLRSGPGRRRTVAAMVTTGLLVKLFLEAPWGPALRVESGWDIALAPLAHAGGALAGLLGALACGVGRGTAAQPGADAAATVAPVPGPPRGGPPQSPA